MKYEYHRTVYGWYALIQVKALFLRKALCPICYEPLLPTFSVCFHCGVAMHPDCGEIDPSNTKAEYLHCWDCIAGDD